MPSVNLIWEQRLVRRKNQRIALAMLTVIGLSVLVLAGKMVDTYRYRRWCESEIGRCEERIRLSAALAERNRQVQAEITTLEPTLGLLEEAQRITLRWVSLMSELDRSVTDPVQLAFNQLGFAVTPTTPAGSGGAGAAATAGMIGKLTVAGSSRNYALLSRTMRNLDAQRHVTDVRLVQAQTEGQKRSGPIRFTLQAQFCIPDDEEQVLVAALTAPAGGRDYAAVIQKAGEETVLNRVPPGEAKAQ